MNIGDKSDENNPAPDNTAPGYPPPDAHIDLGTPPDLVVQPLNLPQPEPRRKKVVHKLKAAGIGVRPPRKQGRPVRFSDERIAELRAALQAHVQAHASLFQGKVKDAEYTALTFVRGLLTPEERARDITILNDIVRPIRPFPGEPDEN
jgi:hypothetical protein